MAVAAAPPKELPGTVAKRGSMREGGRREGGAHTPDREGDE